MRVVIGFDLSEMGRLLSLAACCVMVAYARVSMFVSALKEVKK